MSAIKMLLCLPWQPLQHDQTSHLPWGKHSWSHPKSVLSNQQTMTPWGCFTSYHGSFISQANDLTSLLILWTYIFVEGLPESTTFTPQQTPWTLFKGTVNPKHDSYVIIYLLLCYPKPGTQKMVHCHSRFVLVKVSHMLIIYTFFLFLFYFLRHSRNKKIKLWSWKNKYYYAKSFLKSW